MTYKETLVYLFNQLPMYQKVGESAVKKNLDNITILCDYLDNPQESYPVIHIAGTNGKGTTAHMIAAILQASGLRVGLYTSPHYVDFRERIKVNGVYIEEAYVVDFVRGIRDSLEAVEPSFFELTVAMAFDYFNTRNVDIAIIETGLGGRLDSTNIVNPIISVITNISLDHQHMLGHNVYNIAKEKAGIIKPSTPVVVGKYQPSCDHVFMTEALNMESHLVFAPLNWNVECDTDSNRDMCRFYRKKTGRIINISIFVSAPFIIENTVTALEVISVYEHLKGVRIGSDIIESAIVNFKSRTNYKGRWEVLGSQPLVIADSAHNLEALKIVLHHLSRLNYQKIHFILGFVKDKDLHDILLLFDPSQQYYFIAPSVPRGLSASQLSDIAADHDIDGRHYESLGSALSSALNNAHKDDLVYIGGSSFVVADALALHPHHS